MTAQKIRHSIHEIVDQTSNTAILKAYHDILMHLLKMEKALVVAYDSRHEPITESEYIQQIVEASLRVKSGKYIRHADLEKQVEGW